MFKLVVFMHKVMHQNHGSAHSHDASNLVLISPLIHSLPPTLYTMIDIANSLNQHFDYLSQPFSNFFGHVKIKVLLTLPQLPIIFWYIKQHPHSTSELHYNIFVFMPLDHFVQ